MTAEPRSALLGSDPPEPIQPPKSDSRSQRSTAVDLLRAAAILLVLGCHYVVAPDAAGIFTGLATLWYRIGWTGVDLFFVLSGYLVSGLLFAEYRKTGALDLRRFLVRRGFKIWPAYFAYLGLVAAWLIFQQSRGHDGGLVQLWPNLLHVQNYLGSVRVHTWSLAVEEHFYLALALGAASALAADPTRRLLRYFPLLAFAALVFVALARRWSFDPQAATPLNLYATHLRFDGLLWGTLLAYCLHYRPHLLRWPLQHPGVALVAGIVLALPVVIATPEAGPWAAGEGLSLMYVGFALVVLAVIGLERRGHPLLRTRAAQRIALIGVFSYGIYLWHIDLAQTPCRKIGALLGGMLDSPSLVWAVSNGIYLAVAIGAGALLSRAIEFPALALRDRLFPAATRTAPRPAAPQSAGPAPIPAPMPT